MVQANLQVGLQRPENSGEAAKHISLRCFSKLLQRMPQICITTLHYSAISRKDGGVGPAVNFPVSRPSLPSSREDLPCTGIKLAAPRKAFVGARHLHKLAMK